MYTRLETFRLSPCPSIHSDSAQLTRMLQSIIGVLFGTNNRVKIQLDKSIYYTGDEVKKTGAIIY